VVYSPQPLKQHLKAFLTEQIVTLPHGLILDIIQIGDNLASTKYVQMKQKMGRELGITVNHHHFPDEPTLAQVQKVLDQATNAGHGIIFQLPVPPAFQDLVRQTPDKCDVDLLGSHKDHLWHHGILPPTIQPIDLVLKDLLHKNQPTPSLFNSLTPSLPPLQGKTFAVIGQGRLVGSFMVRYLLERQATVISVNEFTPNPQDLVRQADIVISAVGKANLVDTTWLRQGAMVIDAATTEDHGSLVGDINYESLESRSDVTVCPSPGGIGGLTVLCLFWNLVKLQQL
jgi:5,10-methylene-tetrahydrofolate dehydrogenase/methenyl tetrahydrofolate cyclohydrolase